MEKIPTVWRKIGLHGINVFQFPPIYLSINLSILEYSWNIW